MFTKEDLITHFECIINDLHHNELSNDILKDLSFLYIQHKYKKYKETNEETNEETNLKYFALGWYIYNFLLIKKY